VTRCGGTPRRSLFARIEADPRHGQVHTLAAESVGERVFARWAMARIGSDGSPDTPLIAHDEGISAASSRGTTPAQDALLTVMREAATDAESAPTGAPRQV